MNIKKTRNPISNFYRGFLCPFQSFTFVRQHRNLHKFIIIPFLLNLLIFSLVVYLGGTFFQEQVLARMPQGEAWYWLILNYFVMVMAAVLVLVMIFFTFTAVGCLIASPFNDLLSERTELLLTGPKDDNSRFSIFAFSRDTAQTMLVELKKISVFLVGMLLLLFLHFIPVLGAMLYPVLSISWTVFFLIMEYTGYVFSRQKKGFKEQCRVVFRYLPMMTGFGTGLFLVLAIPFMQFLCMPLGVVGAVRMLYQLDELEGSSAASQNNAKS